jgi:hypothetical protein
MKQWDYSLIISSCKTLLLAHVNCTGDFHCDISIHAYDVPLLDSPLPLFSLVLHPSFLKQFQ